MIEAIAFLCSMAAGFFVGLLTGGGFMVWIAVRVLRALEGALGEDPPKRSRPTLH